MDAPPLEGEDATTEAALGGIYETWQSLDMHRNGMLSEAELQEALEGNVELQRLLKLAEETSVSGVLDQVNNVLYEYELGDGDGDWESFAVFFREQIVLRQAASAAAPSVTWACA